MCLVRALIHLTPTIVCVAISGDRSPEILTQTVLGDVRGAVGGRASGEFAAAGGGGGDGGRHDAAQVALLEHGDTGRGGAAG